MIYEAQSLAFKRMSKGREDGSVGKMLSVKHTDQTLILRTHGKSHGKLSRVFLLLRRQRETALWAYCPASLAELVSSRFSETPCFKNYCEERTEEDT